MKALVNILIYQVIWFLAVFAGNIGALCGALLLPVHLLMSGKRGFDLWMMVFMLAAGLVIDGTLQHIGFYTFSSGGFPIPFWLAVIWVGLAITPGHSLIWMRPRPVLCAIFGALGGPAAYWAGVRLGAAGFNWPLPLSLLTLAAIWAFFWPLTMAVSGVIERRLAKPGSKNQENEKGTLSTGGD